MRRWASGGGRELRGSAAGCAGAEAAPARRELRGYGAASPAPAEGKRGPSAEFRTRSDAVNNSEASETNFY